MRMPRKESEARDRRPSQAWLLKQGIGAGIKVGR
jgi:hypothetical protein